MKSLSSSSVRTLSYASGAEKLGQPVPESNFVSDVKSGLPHATQRYVPFSFVLSYSPVNGRSVPFSRVTWYCSGVSSRFHSSSVFRTFSMNASQGGAILSVRPDRAHRDRPEGDVAGAEVLRKIADELFPSVLGHLRAPPDHLRDVRRPLLLGQPLLSEHVSRVAVQARPIGDAFGGTLGERRDESS